MKTSTVALVVAVGKPPTTVPYKLQFAKPPTFDKLSNIIANNNTSQHQHCISPSSTHLVLRIIRHHALT